MKTDVCCCLCLVSSLLVAVFMVCDSALCNYDIPKHNLQRHAADRTFVKNIDIRANDITERNITLLDDDLILQTESEFYKLTSVLNDSTIPGIRWQLLVKRCVEPGYNENLTVSLSERVEPRTGCRHKLFFILAISPETVIIPKPSDGVIDVDYETDNPDNGNRTIIEIGIGKCASLTCNVSYAGSDKQFVMHKRDDRYWWIGTDVGGNDCNMSYNIWIGSSWQLTFFPDKTYSSLVPVTVRFSDARFCSLTKAISPSSSDYPTARDSILTITTHEKPLTPISYTALSSTANYLVTLAAGETERSKRISGSTITRHTIKSTNSWYVTTVTIMTSHSSRYLTSEPVLKTISKVSLANQTHRTEPNKTMATTDRATNVTTSIATLVYKKATLNHVASVDTSLRKETISTNKTTDSLTRQNSPNLDFYTTTLFSTTTTNLPNHTSVSNKILLSQKSIPFEQKSRFTNWFEEPVTIAVSAAVAAVIVTVPILVGLIILIRKRIKKSSIAPSGEGVKIHQQSSYIMQEEHEYNMKQRIYSNYFQHPNTP